ncbi:NUMOD3 domain-containing DNA-binding protein [Pseudomonas sp. C9-3]|uniref:NUMOD3 domain-containing DNA-binding protein n=1 Tax=Pseudomonas sp. C9-3 TaxID=3078264 RepID=UPI0028E9E707|nr:NUMOD3 domain-containing DNA-binding protein [Pseudomonas sp. C9-3]
MAHAVYGLFDPADPEKRIRYVGCSSKTVSRRIIEHISEAKERANSRHLWIMEILDRGERPQAVVLEEVRDGDWQDRERFWIKELSGDLVNSTEGGIGLIGPTDDVRFRIRDKVSSLLVGNDRRLGIPHDDEARSAISDGLLASGKKKASDASRRGKPGHKLSAEAKQKISDANKGRKNPRARELAAAMAEGNVGSFWVNDGTSSKLMRKGNEVPNGWNRGRLPPKTDVRAKISDSVRKASNTIYTPERNAKLAATKKGGRWITNGETNRYLQSGEALPDGWSFGRTMRK